MKRTTGGGRAGGEGGHIIRSTSKKERHSKVYTSKGPRDRRVRLSAHTAIRFFDVQDRLGYDQPSKAVDWLFQKAKNAIDKLAELPPWCPNVTEQAHLSATTSLEIQEQNILPFEYVFQLHKHIQEANNLTGSYIPQEHEEQCIGETMKTFFPTSSGISLENFQNYPDEDQLGLSLHTSTNQVQLSGFETNYVKSTVGSWGNIRNPEENNNGIIFSSSNQAISGHPLFCQSQEFNQREPLQSNNYSHLIHSWGHHRASMASLNHHDAHQSSMSNGPFECSQFQVPARIQGEEQCSGDFPLRPSSNPPAFHFPLI